MRHFMDEMRRLDLTEPLPQELEEPIALMLLLGYHVTLLHNDDEDCWVLTAEHEGTGQRHAARAHTLAELIEAIGASIDLQLALE